VALGNADVAMQLQEKQKVVWFKIVAFENYC
jgi:hypothetical protein